MQNLRIGAAQFEHRNGDKAYNLARMHELIQLGVARGAEFVSFHECCISAYTFAQTLTRDELWELAEEVPTGPSTQQLQAWAEEYGVAIGAGLFEREGQFLYNTYVVVSPQGCLARHRKLHTFVSPYLTPGDQHTVFEWKGTRFGILICYDNNLPENARITTLMGAEVLLMPHVTGCLPSAMPGRGAVDRKLWEARETDPVPLRLEFEGPKQRGWLLRWIPTRAWENGIYVVFTNPIGMDDDTVKGGGAMIIDPFGEVLTESRVLGDDIVVGLCTPEKIDLSSGRRYLRARRPDIYGELVKPPKEPPRSEPGWSLKYDKR